MATDRIGPGACVHVHVQLQVHVNITGVVMLSTSLMGVGKHDDVSQEPETRAHDIIEELVEPD